MPKTALLTGCCVAALAVTAVPEAEAHSSSARPCRTHHSERFCQTHALRRQIPGTRRKAVRDARTLLRRDPRPARLAWRLAPLRREAGYWRRVHRRLQRIARTPWSQRIPRWDAFMCIHRHEGPWTARTGNGYYGGLQMDLSFQRTYGADFLARWGTADRWPPAAQIVVADRAYRSGRGFTPWPNTARACGLL
jgi:hypothetical protein